MKFLMSAPGTAAAAAVLLAASAALTSASAQVHPSRKAQPALTATAGTCAPTNLAFKVLKDEVTSRATTFRDMPNTHLTFRQRTAGCAIVSFSAEAAASRGNFVLVQAVLDNTTVCQPNQNAFAASTGSAAAIAAHAMNYVCPNVPVGRHTIKMQFRGTNGGIVDIFFRTLIVHFLP